MNNDEQYQTFQFELEQLIRKHKLQLETDETILSSYLVSCLKNFEMYIQFREFTKGRVPKLF